MPELGLSDAAALLEALRVRLEADRLLAEWGTGASKVLIVVPGPHLMVEDQVLMEDQG